MTRSRLRVVRRGLDEGSVFVRAEDIASAEHSLAREVSIPGRRPLTRPPFGAMFHRCSLPEVEGIAVLASGSGTILEAILEAGVPVSVVVVDRPCRAIEVATGAGIPATLVERHSFGAGFDRLAFTHSVLDALAPYAPSLVVMAGFGTVLEKPLFDTYPDRVLNTHPSLLPAFPGWHAVEDALAAGVKVTGCTVHVANLDVDAGPILAQEAVPVLPGDSVESLHERIKDVERRLYPQTIRELIGS